jgi:two-component system, chemotaxis family, chemotaxis protein CheY
VREGTVLKTCLVVDDSAAVRRVSRMMLEDLGFHVTEACNGEEALTWCRATLPEAILLDWNMPIMSGIDFLRQLRQEPSGNGPKVLFCTVENDLTHIRQALEAGIDEYIMKPFDAEVLRSKLTEVGLL